MTKFDDMNFNELMEEYFKTFETSIPPSCIDKKMITEALINNIPIKSKDI